MPHFKSIVARIFWMHVLAVGSVAILVPLSLYLLLLVETRDLQRKAMEEQADRIAEHLVLDGEGQWHLELRKELRDVYSEAYGRYSYAVLDDRGGVLFSSRNGRAIFPDEGRSSQPEFLQVVRGPSIVSGVRVPKTVSDRLVFIEVAENLSHRDALLDDVVTNFVPRVAWITVPILLLLLAINAKIVRRAFQPVRDASRQASEIGPARTDVRLSLEGIPNEIAPLVTAFNEALDRLDRGFQVQREFTADAAHELRTPMTILRTRIDTLGDPALSDALRRDVESMTRIINQLLEMAEVEAMALDEGERANLQAVAADVIAYLAPLAFAKDKSIALVGTETPVWVIGHAEMIARAIRNLVENAVRHTPPGTSVDVEVTSYGAVHVRDSGPGISEGDREHLFRRFWRHDRKKSGGAGLGLSIVQRIMQIHRGAVTFANRPEGGAVFSLSFRVVDRPDETSSLNSVEEPGSGRPRPLISGGAVGHA